MSDDLARLLEIIAETFDANAAIMATAAKHANGSGLTPEDRAAGRGRPLLAASSQGSQDAFMVCAEFVREIAVAPPQARGQIAARLRLIDGDLGETVFGHQYPEATRA